MLTQILLQEELTAKDVKAIVSDKVLFDALGKKDYLLMVDWSGEDKMDLTDKTRSVHTARPNRCGAEFEYLLRITKKR